MILVLALGLCLVPVGAQEPPADPMTDFYAGHPQLNSYIRQALDRNPGLAEALARYRAALQQVPQVTALPDPRLSFTQFLRDPETRVGPQLNSYSLSQKLPWFGKLSLQGKVAAKAARERYHEYRARQREIIAQVKAAFYELDFVDRALQINREDRSLLDHYEELAQARYASGAGLKQAVVKIQAEITRILDRLEILGQRRETLVARLNTLMNRPPESPLPTVSGLKLPAPALNLQELYELGERNRPQLQAAMSRIERSEQSIELAKKDFWPDVTVGAGFINVGGRSDPAALLLPPPDEGKNAFSFSVSLNIPIRRSKYAAGVIEATESLIADRKLYLNRRNDMEFAIRDQVVRLQTLREEMHLFEQVLIPQAREALRSTESAYQTGEVGALDLLDSERVLLEVRLVDARYKSDYLRALARLEFALGTRFPR